MARVIPGVQVDVVKEVVPPQLAPSGVLGLIGFTEKIPENISRASSWSRFIEVFGAASAYAIPEARQALENGVFELVVSPLKSSSAIRAKANIEGFEFTANIPGTWANNLVLKIIERNADTRVFDIEIRFDNAVVEILKTLNMQAGDDRYIGKILFKENSKSGFIHLSNDIDESAAVPNSEAVKFSGGTEAVPDDYDNALAALANEADVDMLIASVGGSINRSQQEQGDDAAGEEDNSVARIDVERIRTIYSKVIAHCNLMAADSKGRIGFGQVVSGMQIGDAPEAFKSLKSDRFVMVAPHGVVGAVAGRVGSLDYYRSPTFKTLAGLGKLSQVLGLEDQRALLNGNIVPVISQRGRGVIVLRGLTTDGDQISVRRVADHAVRGVKMLGDLFIGRLNTEDGRNALKQKLIEFLVQMQKENAIVPSSDGLDPAFKLDVYSSQADFAKSIVRVDMAIRPVRAIDFIYATILVQV